jgi:hypothetical protein
VVGLTHELLKVRDGCLSGYTPQIVEHAVGPGELSPVAREDHQHVLRLNVLAAVATEAVDDDDNAW